jgi:hypothetical protein
MRGILWNTEIPELCKATINCLIVRNHSSYCLTIHCLSFLYTWLHSVCLWLTVRWDKTQVTTRLHNHGITWAKPLWKLVMGSMGWGVSAQTPRWMGGRWWEVSRKRSTCTHFLPRPRSQQYFKLLLEHEPLQRETKAKSKQLVWYFWEILTEEQR